MTELKTGVKMKPHFKLVIHSKVPGGASFGLSFPPSTNVSHQIENIRIAAALCISSTRKELAHAFVLIGLRTT